MDDAVEAGIEQDAGQLLSGCVVGSHRVCGRDAECAEHGALRQIRNMRDATYGELRQAPAVELSLRHARIRPKTSTYAARGSRPR